MSGKEVKMSDEQYRDHCEKCGWVAGYDQPDDCECL